MFIVSFLVDLYNKKSLSVQIHLLKLRHDIRMAAVKLQVTASYFAEYSENFLFISTNAYKKDNVCYDYCVFFHNDNSCFVSICKFQIILLGNTEELLKKLDAFCFTYQHAYCLYTFFSNRFIGKIFAKSGHVFDNVQRAVDFNHKNKGVEGMPSIAKRRLLRKKFKKHLISCFQKTKTTQSSTSMIAERIEKKKQND